MFYHVFSHASDVDLGMVMLVCQLVQHFGTD